MQPGLNFDVRVEVESDCVVVVLSTKTDNLLMVWEDAWVFGETLEKAAEDIPNKPLIANPIQEELSADKIKLGTDARNKLVCLFFDHTDRLKFTYEAARVVARCIRLKAQDLDYLNTKKVAIRYNVKGREGRPTPDWDPNRLPKNFTTH